MPSRRSFRLPVFRTIAALCMPLHAHAQPAESKTARLPDFACGPAAAAIMLMLCDREADNEVLHSIVGPDGEASLADVAQLLRDHALFVEPVRLAPSDLTRLPCPAILHARFSIYADLPPVDHFTVCSPVPMNDSHVLLLDPLAVVGRGLVPRDVAAVKMSGPALLVSTEPIDLTGLDLARESENVASLFPSSGIVLALGAALLSFGATWLMARPHSKVPDHAPPIPGA